MPLLSAVPLSCAAHRNAKYRFLGLSLSLLLVPPLCPTSPQISDIPDHATEESRGWRVLDKTDRGGGWSAPCPDLQNPVRGVGTHIGCWVLRTLCVCHTHRQQQFKNLPLKNTKTKIRKKKTKKNTKKYKNKIRKHTCEKNTGKNKKTSEKVAN